MKLTNSLVLLQEGHPGVEHIENLTSKREREYEKLIFRILKRGEKLKISEAKEEK